LIIGSKDVDSRLVSNDILWSNR